MAIQQNYLKEYLLKRKKEKGYICIPYIILGYPTWEKSYQIACELLKNGADSLELGIPFTDPIADGLTIQLAFQKVLEKEFSVKKVFQFVEKLRKTFPQTPFAVMGYSNFFYHYGNYKKIFSQFQKNEIYDYVIPDVPYEEQQNIFNNEKNINFVNFITLNTSIKKMKQIAKNSNNFIYAVSTRGTTGIQEKFDIHFYKKHITKIQEYTSTPILIGFGIYSKEQVEKTILYADGFIVGSYLIEAIQGESSPIKIANMLSKILP